jgi:hypothetical protein
LSPGSASEEDVESELEWGGIDEARKTSAPDSVSDSPERVARTSNSPMTDNDEGIGFSSAISNV